MALIARANGSVFFHSNSCFSKLISNYAKVKFYEKLSLIPLKLNEHLYSVRFLYTGRIDFCNTTKGTHKYVPYDDLLAERRLEARRSVLVEVQSEKSSYDVYTYCSTFGKVENIFHYANYDTDRHFLLIEFKTEKDVAAILKISTHINFDQIIPTQSTMLWFRSLYKHKIDKKGQKDNGSQKIQIPKNCCKILNTIEVIQKLYQANSISDQILSHYESTKLNDVGVRLRFYTALQIENSFQGCFPNLAVLPFGSSVNGFGKQGCDLDLSIVFERDPVENTESRLVYQTKSVSSNDRFQKKKLIEVIADELNIFLPGISNVRKISEARVPIIKFNHNLTGIECDMAINNMSGYYMSELLYMYGEMDWRVRPLTFTMKTWAHREKLTSKNPGPWITNFSLSLMMLFFLQRKKILPSLNQLKLSATKDDQRTADDFVDCTFQRDITKIVKNDNTESLGDLLVDFFTFYGNFDFETRAISLREAKDIPKPFASALCICNPLEPSLNVSKNVRFDELERMRVAMRNATWKLETDIHDKSENWGLLQLFNNTDAHKPIKITRKNDKKQLNIQQLFDEDPDHNLNRKERYKKSVSKTKL